MCVYVCVRAFVCDGAYRAATLKQRVVLLPLQLLLGQLRVRVYKCVCVCERERERESIPLCKRLCLCIWLLATVRVRMYVCMYVCL